MIGPVQLHFGGSLLLLVFENFGLGRILTKLIWWLEVTIVKGKLNGAGCYSEQRWEGQALSEAGETSQTSADHLIEIIQQHNVFSLTYQMLS